MSWRRFTPEDDAYLVAHYATQPVGALAIALGRAYGSVQYRINALIGAGQLARHTRAYQSPWTGADLAYLEAQWGRRADATIARHLHRTMLACALKAKRLGLRRMDAALTARAVARVFAVDEHVVVRWIGRGWLTGRPRPIRAGRTCWLIDPAAVDAFIRTHPTAYNRLRIDPEEYGYYRRLADRTAAAAGAPPPAARHAQHWTAAEDAYLVDHWGQIPDTTVAAALGRTPYACRCRAYHLAITRHDALTGWFTVAQAAAHLGVSDSRVRSWMTRGLLPATRSAIRSSNGSRVWRLSPAAVAAFATAHPDLVAEPPAATQEAA